MLVIDDLGCLPQDAEEPDMLLSVIAERCERRSMDITSDLVLSDWDRVFTDCMATAAAIDRVLHHSVFIEVDVPSDRTHAARKWLRTAD